MKRAAFALALAAAAAASPARAVAGAGGVDGAGGTPGSGGGGAASLAPALPAGGTATVAPALPSAGTAPAEAPEKPPSLCIERLPEGKARPTVKERIAPRGTSGHAHLLELTIEHGAGETVLPAGFRVAAASDDLKRLEAGQFFLPDPAGGVAPSVDRKVTGDRATTQVKLYFVPLPEKPGRNQLVLPSLPIAISRASGEVMTLCTAPHEVTIEDPIANQPNPEPKPNPPPRRQIEEWTLAKHVTYAALIALAVGALAAFVIGRWMRRPKPVPPPPPARPPWEVALEALYDVRHSGLAREQRFVELYDRTSDILRRYLGDRYGYDGLESTTREALAALRRVALPMDTWVEIQTFMQDADLVKFAKRSPTEAECQETLERVEALIHKTRPTEPQAFPNPAQAPEVRA